MHDGLVVVDKPAGCTSHDVVARLRKIYGQRKVGHAGTLDPDATGVLLVGLGRVTRLLRYLQETTKVYRGTVRFGVATSTLDAAGDVLERAPMTLTREDVFAASQRFLGDIEQIPPMVSAIKIDGKRLHELARRGEEVDRPPRAVHIARLDVEGFEDGSYPAAEVLVECTSGTYIRTLAADLGAALGGCAHLESLRRCAVGSFGLDEAHDLDAIGANPVAVLVAPLDAMRALERVDVDAACARAVSHGSTFAGSALPTTGEGPYALASPAGELLAVYERTESGFKPSVVVVADAE